MALAGLDGAPPCLQDPLRHSERWIAGTESACALEIGAAPIPNEARCVAHVAPKGASHGPRFPGEPEESLGLQTNSEALFNLLNNCLGVSILGVPYTCKLLGLGLGLLAYAASAYVNRYTTHIVLKACQLARVPVSYSDIAKHCFGRVGSAYVSLCVVMHCVTINVAYVVTMAEVFDEMARAEHRTGLEPVFGCTLAVWLLMPFTLIRSMRRMAFVSALATLAAFSETVLVAMPCLDDLIFGRTYVKHMGKEPGRVTWFNFSGSALLESLPIIVLSFANQGPSPVILASLCDGSWSNVKRMTARSFGITLGIFAVFGAAVYLRYTDLVTNNALTTIGESAEFQLARVSGFVLVGLSYIFMNVPTRNVILQSCLGKDEIRQEATYATFAVVTIVLNMVTGLLAVVAIELGGLSFVLRLGGGVCASSLALIIPPALFISASTGGGGGGGLRVLCCKHGGLATLAALGVAVFAISNWSLAVDVMRGAA